MSPASPIAASEPPPVRTGFVAWLVTVKINAPSSRSVIENCTAGGSSSATSGGAPFGTDGCQFARAGIDSLICGPGDLDQAHQPNESIRREAFEHGPDHIVSVIHKMCVD